MARHARPTTRSTLVAATGLAAVVAVISTVLALAGPFGAPQAVAATSIPAGTTAGYAVYDRQTGKTVASRDAHKQFRSASLVKLLIALDYLYTKGSTASVPAADNALLQSMLRSSDDDAASKFWVRGGYEQVITRMVSRIGLVDTVRPTDRRYWGYTALSAADVVTTYNFLLDRAPASYRELILGNLEKATRCAADGFDQSFGLPRGVAGTKAIKQGWSGYGAAPATRCVEREVVPDTPPDGESVQAAEEAPQATADARPTTLAAPTLDLSSRAMHTSGLVDSRRRVEVVLTLTPKSTSFPTSSDSISTISRTLHDDAVAASAPPKTTPPPTTTTPPATTPAPTSGPIDAYAAKSAPGPATSSIYAVPGGQARDYRDGTIYWSQATGAHLLRGAVLARYTALGGPGGTAFGGLGFPTTDDVATTDGGGRIADFSRAGGGAIVVAPGTTTARVIYGTALAKWRALGETRSVLAYPSTDTSVTPDGAGRYTHFTGAGGSIYYNPRLAQAYAIYGDIRARWASLGWERSSIGYPTSDEYGVAGGRRNDFDRGAITWNAATRATQVIAR